VEFAKRLISRYGYGLPVGQREMVGWVNRRNCCQRTGAEIRKRRVDGRNYSNWRWHLDEVFVRIDGERHYLWRAVDHEGEVLEAFVTTRRDRQAALEFLKRTMKRHGQPSSIVTDRLPSYRAAMKALGNPNRQDCGRWLNNRSENSHLPFRRREGAMARFRDIKTLQKFAAVHGSIYNHFNHQRSLNRRQISRSFEPPLWPSGVNWLPDNPRKQIAQVRYRYSDNAVPSTP